MELARHSSKLFQKGYCSAALKAYKEYLQEPDSQILDYTPQMFCQLSLLWLLEQRENKINSLSAEKTRDFVKFFDGENSQFLFSKLGVDDPGLIGKLSGGKVGTINKEEVTEKIKFLYEETFPIWRHSREKLLKLLNLSQ